MCRRYLIKSITKTEETQKNNVFTESDLPETDSAISDETLENRSFRFVQPNGTSWCSCFAIRIHTESMCNENFQRSTQPIGRERRKAHAKVRYGKETKSQTHSNSKRC